jgi:TolB-like protein/DNA-binding winged helix-turn-helix (wHTH) protein/Tfp pilus assembly protein PilF
MNPSAVLEWWTIPMLSLPAMDPRITTNWVRFGEFEVDLRTGELRNDGRVVHLPLQPFQLLALLLERPGELVTREELRQKLWPADTFVDFDVGLNSAIRKLRDALGDSAEHPAYVETLPRRGYRLIAPVPELDSPAIRDETTAPVPASLAAHRRHVWVLAVAALCASVIALFAFDVGGFRRLLSLRPARGEIRAIAVLPLENLTGDPNQEYFADGMTDALITDLAQIRGLRVTSRTSALRYKGARKTLPEIAKELSVDAVVEGTVARSGNRVRIDAQLIQASTDRHLWARSYERDLSDILSLQRDLARAIAAEVAVNLSPQEQSQLARARAVNPDAYESYLKGRYFFNKRNKEALLKSIEYLQQAILKDPEYAPAYAALSETYTVLGAGMPAGLPKDVAGVKALPAAEQAVKLDPASAEAHAALGLAKDRFTDDRAGTEQEFRRAIDLNPGYATAHHWYALYLMRNGRPEEAFPEMRRALQLDPVSPNINGAMANLLMTARQYDKALEQARRTVELDPNQFNSRIRMAWSYVLADKYEEALPELKKAEEISPGSSVTCGVLGYVYGHLGNKGEAERVLNDCKNLPPLVRRSSSVALIYLGLGQREEAIRWMQKSYAEHDLWPRPYRNLPEFDDLRRDPRFQELERRMDPELIPGKASPG